MRKSLPSLDQLGQGFPARRVWTYLALTWVLTWGLGAGPRIGPIPARVHPWPTRGS